MSTPELAPHRMRRSAQAVTAAQGAGARHDALASRIGRAAMRELGLDATGHDAAALAALGREVVVDYINAAPAQRAQFMVGLAGLADEGGTATAELKSGIPVYAALDELAALRVPTRHALARDLLTAVGLDPARKVDIPQLVDPENILAENQPKPAADYYFNNDTLSATDIQRMSDRPLAAARIERILARLPASLDAEFGKRFDAHTKAVAAASIRLMQAWLAAIAAKEGGVPADMTVTLARASLGYYRMERPRFRDEVFHYPGETKVEIPADGYFASIRTPAGMRRYFLCARTGHAWPLPAQGSLASAIKGAREIVFGKAEMAAVAAQHPVLAYQRVEVRDMANGAGDALADWLAPVFVADAARAREAARGHTPAEASTEALLNAVIPFRAMIMAIRRGDAAAALLAGGLDILALIPLLGWGLRVAKGGVALGRFAVAQARRAGVAGLQTMASQMPGMRESIRAGLGILDRGARLWGRLRPLDTDRIVSALKGTHTPLADALRTAAARTRGAPVRDGWWQVRNPGSGLAAADDAIRASSPVTVYGSDGTTLKVLPYGQDGRAYTLYDAARQQRLGAVLVSDPGGWLYESLPADSLARYCVSTPLAVQALTGMRAGTDGTIALGDRHYARIGAEHVEVTLDRAASTPGKTIWRVVTPDGVLPDIVTHRLVYDGDKALWRRADVPLLKAGGQSGSRPADPPAGEGLLACVVGGATGRQAARLRALQDRLQADPRGAALLRALHAHQELLGHSMEIVLRDGPLGEMARPSLNNPVYSNTWYLGLRHLEDAPIDVVVGELAAVYNNMTGLLHEENPFERVLARGKPRLDPLLEKAWRQWVAEAPPSSLAQRQLAVQELKAQLREAYCFGGMARADFEALLGMGATPPDRLGLRVRLVRLELDSLPPLPPEVQRLEVAFNRITDWRNLPRDLAVLDISQNELLALPGNLPPSLKVLKAMGNELSHLPANLPRNLKRLDVSANRLAALPVLPETLEELYASVNTLRALPADLPRALRKLDVQHNDLHRLPSVLPPSLDALYVSHNALEALPDALPEGLRLLDADTNLIAALPPLPAGLRKLNISHNQLRALPPLPVNLHVLIARANRLSALPDGLPVTLTQLQLSGNRLSDLPADIARLTSCVIYIDDNPIPPERIPSFRADAVGPRVFFSVSEAGYVAPQPFSIAQALRRWLNGEAEEAAIRWETILDTLEPSSTVAFCRFLDRLRDPVSFKDAAFRADIVDWLVELSRPERAELRQATLGACLGSTETCQDRVSWTLNQVKSLRLNDDIRLGRYDDRAGEVIAAARQMFRLNVLTDIARRKVGAMSAVDEIEVYLAYAVKLRDVLDLTTVVPHMRYYAVSGVSDADLAEARETVLAREREEFERFLALDYEPWQGLLQRKDPDAYAAVQRELAEEGESRFEHALQEAMAKLVLDPDDRATLADARKDLGPAIMREVQYHLWEPLVRKYLGPLPPPPPAI